jgi:hypothetical protein
MNYNGNNQECDIYRGREVCHICGNQERYQRCFSFMDMYHMGAKFVRFKYRDNLVMFPFKPDSDELKELSDMTTEKTYPYYSPFALKDGSYQDLLGDNIDTIIVSYLKTEPGKLMSRIVAYTEKEVNK